MRLFYRLTSCAFLLLTTFTNYAQLSYDMADQTVTDTAGYLYDAGGPGANYYDNDTVTFTIDVGAGKELKLQWLEFNVETAAGLANVCLYDWLEIFDGDATAELVTRYCGSTRPADFISTTGKITLRFTSDGGSNLPGFKAYWTTGELLPVTGGYCPGIVGEACKSSWCN